MTLSPSLLFAHRLALELGCVNVNKMLRSITAKQFMAWEAFNNVEPIGEIHADYRAASIVQMIANVNRGSTQRAYTLQDFLLKFEQHEKVQQSPETQERYLRIMFGIPLDL